MPKFTCKVKVEISEPEGTRAAYSANAYTFSADTSEQIYAILSRFNELGLAIAENKFNVKIG